MILYNSYFWEVSFVLSEVKEIPGVPKKSDVEEGSPRTFCPRSSLIIPQMTQEGTELSWGEEISWQNRKLKNVLGISQRLIQYKMWSSFSHSRDTCNMSWKGESLICNKGQTHVAVFLVLETKTYPPQGMAEPHSHDGGALGRVCVRKGKTLPSNQGGGGKCEKQPYDPWGGREKRGRRCSDTPAGLPCSLWRTPHWNWRNK